MCLKKVYFYCDLITYLLSERCQEVLSQSNVLVCICHIAVIFQRIMLTTATVAAYLLPVLVGLSYDDNWQSH